VQAEVVDGECDSLGLLVMYQRIMRATYRGDGMHGSEPDGHELVHDTLRCPWSVLWRSLHDPLDAVILHILSASFLEYGDRKPLTCLGTF